MWAPRQSVYGPRRLPEPGQTASRRGSGRERRPADTARALWVVRADGRVVCPILIAKSYKTLTKLLQVKTMESRKMR